MKLRLPVLLSVVYITFASCKSPEQIITKPEPKQNICRTFQASTETKNSDSLALVFYVVKVRFIVEKDGTLTNINALEDTGYGLSKASEDVVRSSPKWTPAKCFDLAVHSYHMQPIIFIIEPEECDSATTVTNALHP